ncbi:MAG: hypothetical protein EHM46_02750 [Bacteroidetes bacterium]|nr:MAG: hypothetical protein EHM46_02750 [Bacteroidota bacterium]
MEEVSTPALFEICGRPGIRIIDVRSPDAYNGWALKGESRGGHIKGARNFPRKWTGYMDWIEMARRKDLREDEEMVFYGYSREETELVAGVFRRAGYSRTRVYDHFFDEWVRNEALPMDRLHRFDRLVPARWVR